MEHRLDSRNETAIAITARDTAGRKVAGTIINISGGGMFIRTVAPLAKNLAISMVFALPYDGRPEIHTVTGIVVHKSVSGGGVMFMRTAGRGFQQPVKDPGFTRLRTPNRRSCYERLS